MKRIMIVCAALAALIASTMQAAEVAPKQAKTATGNWIRRNPVRMGAKFRTAAVKDTVTARDKSGRAIYHVVNLAGGGFVVTSGDTRLTPIVAFSDTGRYCDDKDNPLYVLLQADRTKAVAAVNDYAGKARDRFAAAESEWESLLSKDGGNSAKDAASVISDVYVDRLVKTKWGQSYWNGSISSDQVFNYSTPYSYVCGCVATVGGQIMRYWQHPKAVIPQFSNTCWIDGVAYTRNSIEGAFNWANMPLSYETTPNVTENNKKAIGMLMYNVGVAVGMSWTSDSSGAAPAALPNAFASRFGYASGGTFVQYDVLFPMGYAAQEEDLRNALYASLDAGMPVCVSLRGGGGHAVIADGYGDIASATYTHLNMGWAGINDAWYTFSDDLPGPNGGAYTAIDGLVFNIHPEKKGDVISGRVYTSKFTILPGATVKLYDASNNLIETTTASENGIYSFRVTASGTYYVQASYNAVLSDLTEVDMSNLSSGGLFGSGGRTGNKCGNILKIETTVAADAYDPGDNTAAGGTLLTPTDAEQTHGPHTLSPTDECDFFRIEMTPGTKYVFESVGRGSIKGELFNSASADANSIVAYNSYGGVGFNFKIEYIAPSAGTYYLRVSGYGDESLYSLKHSALSLSKPSTYLKVEGFYPSVNCTLPSDAINFASKIDCDGGWTVSVDDTSWVTLTTDCGVGDGYFYFSLPENTGYNRHCVFTVKAGSLTAYKNLTQFGPLGEKPILDAYDPGDDTAAGGSWLDATAAVQTHGPHTLASNDAYDFFRIPMTAGTKYVLESTGSSDMYGELFSSTSLDGGSVASNDDFETGNYNFRIEYTPSVSQTYYLRVGMYDSGTASYSLQYSCVAPAVKRTVTFNANGGNVSPTTRMVDNGASVGSLPTPTRSGYTFNGWFTAASGGSQISASTKVTANVTYYAQWTKNSDPVVKRTVTFNANGGSVSPTTRTVDNGASVGSLPTPMRDGYTFNGWFTAASGGSQISASTTVTGNVTYYAHWTKNGGSGGGGSGGGGSGGGGVTPSPSSCYEVLNASDIESPYEVSSAYSLFGAVYSGCDVVGIVELKLGKVKNGAGKISGTLTDIFGKKHKIISKKISGIVAGSPLNQTLEVNDYGVMSVMIGYREFAGSLGKYHVQSARVTSFGKTAATVSVLIDDVSMFPADVVQELMPTDGVVGMTTGRWSFDKAPSVKWTKLKDGMSPLVKNDTKGLVVGEGRNPSGMKLTYTEKKGTFKGSFKVYALQGEGAKTKLKKYTIKVNGVVADGVGYGTATCKNPSVTWTVRVE